jgi:hypothetical protein
MRSVYALLLRLYPAEYQDLFASEMAAVHARAHAERRRNGSAALLGFEALEGAGLLAGLVREWIAKAASGGEYLIASVPAATTVSPQTEIERCRLEVDALIRKMVHAIAHHDFEGARRYSNEERREREHLQKLLGTSATEQ